MSLLGLFFVFVIIFLTTIFALKIRGMLWQPVVSSPQVRIFGYYSHILTRLKYRRNIQTEFQQSEWIKVRGWLAVAAEWAVIILWALWLGRNFLLNNTTQWLPVDWQLNVQSYFAWERLSQCGACVFWDGSFNGGAPLFTNLLAPMAHPFVILLLLLAGVINGSKLLAVSALILAGLAQWYWGKVLRLSFIPRVWGACLAVVGGYLVGRFEGGLVEVAFSTASFSLVVAIALHLAETGKRRVAVGLGVLVGLAFLSGQGYLQLGFLLGVCPALLILLLDKNFKFRPVWREFAWAAGVAILISAVLWVPFLHIYPQISKPTGIEPGDVQAMGYQPLNLVINDYPFYQSEYLGKPPWPGMTVNYIGWIPVLLALISWRLIPRSKLRIVAFFWLSIILIYGLSSAVTIRWLIELIPESEAILSMARFPSLISGMAVPFILALAAWGLELILNLKWPKLTLNFSAGRTLNFNLTWLIVLLLIWSVRDVYNFVNPWLQVWAIPEDAKFYDITSQIKPKGVQWVEPPYGEWGFHIAFLDNDIKVTNAYSLWTWRDRTPPPSFIRVTRDDVDTSDPHYSRRIEYVNVLSFPDNYYAYVEVDGTKIPCEATAAGGNIDVTCQTDAPGQLMVMENSWSGWNVRLDGRRASLIESLWLSTKAPAGEHVYQFRYRPWDMPLGAVLSLLGVGLAIWLWNNEPKKRKKKSKGGRK
ncbi:MAG: hypothetical protein MHPDNHAH_01215 [Anaerolineales bacterium]|nr:hypothetical protein [Anaerolineales bacterium]